MTSIAPKPPRAKIAPDKALSFIGKTAFVTYNGLSFEVIIKNAKIAYGNVRFLVTPVKGSGEQWVGNIEPKK